MAAEEQEPKYELVNPELRLSGVSAGVPVQPVSAAAAALGDKESQQMETLQEAGGQRSSDS